MIEPPRSRLPAILAVSIGLHLVLGFALTRIPASRDLLRRVIPIRMVEHKKIPPKPKLAPKRLAAKPKAKLPSPRHAARPPSAPRPALVAAGSAPAFGLDVGGAAGGTMEVPVGDSLETAATASAPPPLVLEVGDEPGSKGLERVPTPIGALRVIYPDVARLAGQGGSALIQAFVEGDGRVSRAELISSSAAAFGRAALEAVKQSRFAPARRLGVAVACTIRIPVRFELNAVQVLPAEPVSEVIELPLASASVATPSGEPATEATPSIPSETP